MLRRASVSAVALLIACIILFTLVLPSQAQFESRQELRSGNLLANVETILIPPATVTLFHTQTAADTDSEALALSPLPAATGGGFSLAQTCDDASVAADTGFFSVEFIPYFLPYDKVPGYVIGDNPSWVARSGPISFAGIPANTVMTFPDMTMVRRGINESMPAINGTASGNQTTNRTNNSTGVPAINRTASGNQTTNRTNNSTGVRPATRYDYVVDTNNSRPYLPGNVMQVKTVKNSRGENETVIDRAPQRYNQLYATPEEIANKTIIERMWRDVHLNFNMDRAYVGETCYPDWICPLKNPLTLMPWYPTGLTVIDAVGLTRPGTRLKKVMWPV